MIITCGSKDIFPTKHVNENPASDGDPSSSPDQHEHLTVYLYRYQHQFVIISK